MKRVLLLDNHDSFTYSLAELLRRNDKITFNIVLPEHLDLAWIESFDKIMFSPGPGLPGEQPVMFEVLERYGRSKAILGICLGFQAIALYFGGRLFNLSRVVHGESVKIKILRKDHYLFQGIQDLSEAGLYHSWAVEPGDIPEDLEILAVSPDGIVMALAHKTLPVCGVQFHPESVITTFGPKLVNNWLLGP
jgi:anthranilate synthase/aminodeoxychorismate synthase-like glutamine amidotransferase